MYARNVPVYCKPSPGLGLFGLYAECGAERASIIAATHNAPVIMPNPAEEITKWLSLMRSLFRPEESSNVDHRSCPVHVWAIPEPWLSQKHSSIRAMGGIANLRKVFWIVDNLVGVEPEDSPDRALWHELADRTKDVFMKHRSW